ncbi:HAD family hydrolase [Desulfotignum balticum]|jgi:HAD superfamily hydrolase (TIGR01509 family)|uniref:HAD family hydrolase n=1 Tax=Desulfotignum balticum TaxID=115781 RepID=UPI000421446A|nr:HAD-IA family hydrolase [Desulfotignum balticum]
MNLSKIKAVVFDCDGVMFDTAMANRKFYDLILDHFNKPPLTDTQFIQVHMMTVADAVSYLFAEMTDLKPVFQCVKQIGAHNFIPYMEIADGLAALLANLKCHGYIRAVATNRTDTMEQVLIHYGLKDQFDMVVTAADVKNPKPHPEALIKIMDRFSLNPDQILFIGDSMYDQQAAKAAGTVFAAFRQPQLEADLYAKAMADIASALGVADK